MNDLEMHAAFVPQGCEHVIAPQPAVTLGAGIIGLQAYDAVTTQGGRYVTGVPDSSSPLVDPPRWATP